MDIDDRLRDWGSHRRAAGDLAAGKVQLSGIPAPRRRRTAVAVAASVSAVLALAVGLAVAFAISSDDTDHHRGAAPMFDPLMQVECSPGQSFQAGLLDTPTIDLTRSTRPDEVAFREFLSGKPEGMTPLDKDDPGRSWLAIHLDPKHTLFLSYESGIHYRSQGFEQKQRRWRWSGSGGCLPTRVFANQTVGRLVAARPSPSNNRALVVVPEPSACGTKPEDAQFRVSYTREAIKIAVTYPEPGPGLFPCAALSRPPTYNLQLTELVGDRDIYDNGYLAPQKVSDTSVPGDQPPIDAVAQPD